MKALLLYLIEENKLIGQVRGDPMVVIQFAGWNPIVGIAVSNVVHNNYQQMKRKALVYRKTIQWLLGESVTSHTRCREDVNKERTTVSK